MKARYDKPIPMGWYAVEYSGNLKAGEVKPLYYFGRELVLFRTESGQAVVMNAYCPHLGAHLGHGGLVKGENISCPFHAWEFNCTGTCTKVPYATRIPPKVDGKQAIHSYPLQELNQMIWVWYHPKNTEPLFDIEIIDELYSSDWLPIEIYDWKINSILQETGENAVDTAHFVAVHGVIGMPESEITIDGAKRLTLLDSEAQEIGADGNIDRTGATTSAARLEAWGIGPGFTYQRFSRMFDIVMMGTITPIDDQSLHLRFNFTLPKEQTDEHKLYAHGFRDEIVRQVQQDIPIWENKTYLSSPVLCDGDGPIFKYRKWFEQFYVT